MNLIDNAINYTTQGRVDVFVEPQEDQTVSDSRARYGNRRRLRARQSNLRAVLSGRQRSKPINRGAPGWV